MEVILPKKKVYPKWQFGDVIVFEGMPLMLAGLGTLEYVCLINLSNGSSWYTNRFKNVSELQRSVEVEKNVTAHYAKDDYRMYIEGP